MTFILRLIGIITVACIGRNDPCNTAPYGLGVYVADGRSSRTPCKTNEVTPPHGAYIRVRSTVSGHWPGRLPCHDGTPCWLYPLSEGDVIRIPGVIDGNGMSAPFEPTPAVQWSTWVPDKLAADVIQRSLASLTITAGKVKSYAFCNGMVYTKGKFLTTGSTVRIIASGTNRYLVVPANSTVDILNLPRHVAQAVPESIDHHADPEHFYLHYTLAEQKPEECRGPRPEPAETDDEDDLVGSIACSNSMYP